MNTSLLLVAERVAAIAVVVVVVAAFSKGPGQLLPAIKPSR